MKIEDVRLAIERDREIIQAYRSHRHDRHIEVFRVEDPAGAYRTTLLYDADLEIWTTWPDEIWVAHFKGLMPALAAFCGQESEVVS